MRLAVLLEAADEEVVQPVIMLYFVDVVHGFPAVQQSAQGSLADQLVLVYPPPAMIAGVFRDENDDVSPPIAG